MEGSCSNNIFSFFLSLPLTPKTQQQQQQITSSMAISNSLPSFSKFQTMNDNISYINLISQEARINLKLLFFLLSNLNPNF
jgi:hypothetical protein